jgi:uncharacterized membrane protein YpjA
MLATLKGWLDAVLHRPLLFWPVIVANALGAVLGGIYWYGPMLWQSPLWAMPFVPDCPLSALLWMIAALGLWFGRRWRFFNALVAFASMKYGIWTVSYWLYVWSHAGFATTPGLLTIEVLLFVAHIGLFVQGLLLVPYSLPLALPARLAIAGWFILSVFVDYVLGYHPPLGQDLPLMFAFWVAAFATAALSTVLIAFAPLAGQQPAALPAHRQAQHEQAAVSQ